MSSGQLPLGLELRGECKVLPLQSSSCGTCQGSYTYTVISSSKDPVRKGFVLCHRRENELEEVMVMDQFGLKIKQSGK